MQTFIRKQEEVIQPSHASWLVSLSSEVSQSNFNVSLLAESDNLLVIMHNDSPVKWGKVGEIKEGKSQILQ
jgi:hypothetical protein